MACVCRRGQSFLWFLLSMAAATGSPPFSDKDRAVVEQYALDQLCKDAKVRSAVQDHEDMFGLPPQHQPYASSRRTRSAAVAFEEEKRNGKPPSATIVPLTFCNNAPKVELGLAGVFKPVAGKGTTSQSGKRIPQPAAAGSKGNRLQQPKQTQPVSSPQPYKVDQCTMKRQRVSPPRMVQPRFWAPSFHGQGSLTGMPLETNSGVRPIFPTQPPAQFVQPAWPDPVMLRKLAAGSAADLKKVIESEGGKEGKDQASAMKTSDNSSNAELIQRLQQTINQMGCTIETLAAKVSTMQDAIRHLETRNREPTLLS